MDLTINEARQELLTIAQDFAPVLCESQLIAISMGEQALKTISDINTKGD